jgi:hypothetical protein
MNLNSSLAICDILINLLDGGQKEEDYALDFTDTGVRATSNLSPVLTVSAFGLRGLFDLALLCFGQRLTQTQMPSRISQTHPQKSVNLSVHILGFPRFNRFKVRGSTIF